MRVGLVKPLSYSTDDSDDSDLALAEITLVQAEALFRADLAVADLIDLKAVGLATADVAALTILVTFHNGRVAHWWAAAAFMAISGVCFFLVLRQREWELGIDPKDFWNKNANRSSVQILEDALASVNKNLEINGPFVDYKSRWFLRGYRLLAVGLGTLLATTVWRLYG
jgi:hypothetical protein